MKKVASVPPALIKHFESCNGIMKPIKAVIVIQHCETPARCRTATNHRSPVSDINVSKDGGSTIGYFGSLWWEDRFHGKHLQFAFSLIAPGDLLNATQYLPTLRYNLIHKLLAKKKHDDAKSYDLKYSLSKEHVIWGLVNKKERADLITYHLPITFEEQAALFLTEVMNDKRYDLFTPAAIFYASGQHPFVTKEWYKANGYEGYKKYLDRKIFYSVPRYVKQINSLDYYREKQKVAFDREVALQLNAFAIPQEP